MYIVTDSEICPYDSRSAQLPSYSERCMWTGDVFDYLIYFYGLLVVCVGVNKINDYTQNSVNYNKHFRKFQIKYEK